MENDYFTVETGEYGQITSLKIKNDEYPTNYVLSPTNASAQKHSRASMAWRADVQRQGGDQAEYSEQYTSRLMTSELLSSLITKLLSHMRVQLMRRQSKISKL
jgi:hypothetical protein